MHLLCIIYALCQVWLVFTVTLGNAGPVPMLDIALFPVELGGVLNYFNKQPEVIVLLVILYKTQ